MKSLISKILSCIIVTMIMTFSVVSLVNVKATGNVVYSTGFETADHSGFSATTTYNGTRTINVDEGAWYIYYGTISTSNKITGSQSLHMRWYASAPTNHPYTTFTLSTAASIKNIDFKYAVSNANLDFDVQYSSDGSNYTDIETVNTEGTTADDYSHEFASAVTVKAIRIAVNGDCTAPSSGNWTFRVDDFILTAPEDSGGGTDPVPTTSISLNETEATIRVNQTLKLTATPTPDNTTDTISWKSSDTDVATVSETGLVTGKDEGVAIISAYVDDGTDTPSVCADCEVTVSKGLIYIDTINFTKPGSGTGYAAYDGEHTIFGIKFQTTNVMIQSSALQFKASTGVLYNTDAIGTAITKIKLDVVSGSFEVLAGSSSDALSSCTIVDNAVTLDKSLKCTYFKIVNGSSTTKFDKISIEYETEEIAGYKVTFNANGGTFATGKGEDISFTDNNSHQVILPSPDDMASTPYTYSVLSKWSDGTTQHNPGAEVTVTGPTTFTAVYASPANLKVAEAEDIANSLSTGATTTMSFNLAGTITAKAISGSYHNLTLTDSTGSIMIWNVSEEVYNSIIVKVNQQVTVVAQIKNYSSTPELVNAEVTLGAHDVYYTITFDVNGGESAVPATQYVLAAELVEKPSDPTRVGYDFTGWYQEQACQNLFDFAVSPTQDYTLYAGWQLQANGLETAVNAIESYFKIAFTYKEVTPGQKYTDVLTADMFAAASTTYSDFNDVSATSSAVYAGNNSKNGSGAIQLRSKNSNSGIVTTTSGGKAKKITVSWDSTNMNTNVLDVYGKDSPYSAASDLYGSSNQGTLIGSITCGTSTELTITGDYEYIGLRSHNGALYIDDITIDWEVQGVGDNTYSDVSCKILVATQLSTGDIATVDSWGLKVVDSESREREYAYTQLTADTTNGFGYRILDLGDVINNIERATVEFTICAYASDGTTTYYSTNTKTFSVATLVKHYVDHAEELNLTAEQQAAVNHFYGVLTAKGCYA